MTGFLIAGECGFGTDDHHLGAGDLGTDLWWNHEGDGRLFRMSFVMATFFSLSPPCQHGVNPFLLKKFQCKKNALL